MSFKFLAAAATAALSLAIAPQAFADTIPLSGSFSSAGVASFYTANFDFNLPANFINATLTIETMSVDDRGVLQLNGADIYATGIFGYAPGGSFDYNNGIGPVPHAFFDNGAQNAVISSGFVSGLNTLRLLINDTGQGIYGPLLNGPNGPSTTTGYNFAGHVDYSLRTGTEVPEPATWALMILGFGATGAMLRRRGLVHAVRPSPD